MPKPLTDQIAALKAKQEALTNRLSVLASKAKTEERKRDTRRKIVVGGAVLAYMEKDPAFKRLVSGILARSVGRSIDREAIADLLEQPAAPPIAAAASPASTATATP